MLRRLRPALLLAAVALAGCFDMVSTVTVRPDGSALVRDSVTFSGMDGLLDDAMRPDKAALRLRAEALGEGVTLAGVATHDDGYTAVYSVRDVGALRYTLPDLDLSDDPDAETVADGPLNLSFAFEPGRPATLRVVVPDEAAGAGDAPVTDEEAAEMRQAFGLMRAMLGEAHVAVRVEVEGRVVESDAAFRDGSVVTLADFAFEDLVDALEATGGAGPEGGLAAFLAGHGDARVQEAGTVTVRFE